MVQYSVDELPKELSSDVRLIEFCPGFYVRKGWVSEQRAKYGDETVDRIMREIERAIGEINA